MAKQKKPPQQTAQAKPLSPSASRWGFRYHAGHLRRALMFLVAAAAVFVCAGQSFALADWFLRDSYVASRATVVKAPYWADALDAQPDPYGAVAGWHIDLQVADMPFTLAVAMSDFDPATNSVDKNQPPSPGRFSVGNVHPVWFYADNRWKQPETVALLQKPPALLISRAAFPYFPTLSEALEYSVELMIAAAIPLAFALMYLIAAFVGKRGPHAIDMHIASRAWMAFLALLAVYGTYLIANDHPLNADDSRFEPAEIIITRAPFADDKLTHYAGYRLVWRTWKVEAKLNTPNSAEFIIDVDALDPRRMPWASRHSPDMVALQPGTKLPVWRSTFHTSNLDGYQSSKPTLYWEAFLSRERWPNRYTWRDFVNDSPLAVAFMAACVAMALVLLIPLFGRRAGPIHD